MGPGAAQEAGELRPGDVCDAYRVVSLIAAGGMGDVYEAVHQASGKTVALKCMKQRHRDKEDARSRMKMEAVVLSELRHANLVQVYDAGVTEAGTIWIAMERLHGRTLRELIHQQGRLAIPDALYYASEVADGVGAVHDANVIHRDLKPENIFITDRKLVKVLDLGTGKFSGYGLKSTDGGRIVGTTAYMAPEQIKGLRVDGRTDVYALGLLAYEMIAGRHPLADGMAGLPRAIEQVALRQLQAVPKRLADVAQGCPPYLSAIIEKAIAKDREARHPSMTVLSAELRAARKRFVAENRLDESSADLRTPAAGLRAKLGAPVRTPTPPTPRLEVDLGKTDLAGPPDFTLDGSRPPPSREPTLELSQSALATPPPGASGGGPFRDPPRVAVAMNLPTRTNPLAPVISTDLTPAPLSLPDGRRTRGGRLRRRLAMTLGLGALLGVPPALFGVYWWRGQHPRQPIDQSSGTSSAMADVPPATIPAPTVSPPVGDFAASPPVGDFAASPTESAGARGTVDPLGAARAVDPATRASAWSPNHPAPLGGARSLGSAVPRAAIPPRTLPSSGL